MAQVVIAGAVRTPFSRYGGTLKQVDSIELGIIVLKELIARTKVPKDAIDTLYYGTCEPMETGVNINVYARQAVLVAGLPPETLSMTIDSACCSSMDAVTFCKREIDAGLAKVGIGMGSENMGRQVYYLPPEFKFGDRTGHIQLIDATRRGGQYTFPGLDAAPTSVDAGKVADEYGISRQTQDEWAVRSHELYGKAYEAGKFKDEMIIPLQIQQEKGNPLTISIDEQYRKDSNLEKLAKLPTVWNSSTITAGNSPGINAGAAAVMVMSDTRAKELGVDPLAAYVHGSRLAGPHRYIAAAPGWAIQKILKETGMSLHDMKLIEINEAFAAMPLVSAKILADGDAEKMKQLLDKTNVNGGAVAIGHPVGASGARLVMTLAYELRRRGGGYGVAALCGGLCQAAACIVKV
jgi:acetyl-CoA C-acetyltransferase